MRLNNLQMDLSDFYYLKVSHAHFPPLFLHHIDFLIGCRAWWMCNHNWHGGGARPLRDATQYTDNAVPNENRSRQASKGIRT